MYKYKIFPNVCPNCNGKLPIWNKCVGNIDEGDMYSCSFCQKSIILVPIHCDNNSAGQLQNTDFDSNSYVYHETKYDDDRIQETNQSNDNNIEQDVFDEIESFRENR